ncbi:flagellar motor protein MotB [Aneurinibacillus aneurinilyticus]|uniref:Putative chemotaxis protein MotB n=1 Tax=Aneurinibacillus aneurinilyticus ATCC 12856 TaxID=649747 RepID=U1Y5S6_ANEAE|nr:flagellar motor protein MotB [Aneurinibacillus aneurinilyticus]ERI07527.1 putative chemotaxis protein MotB [Aneurinibacillus aneurinilyticus ATCC 12856]MED0709529.1 flagellar motor protein MotB [Aneurinibacillus aneurinilyticus]MED0726610.1 flagellar motor protein MotB [Aneurinibacillus aneurinilyticus]MED0733730.1 flagellar motor protein MotB [Aneurinibacillus aneurinilyticus]MED0743599.1 flagellar motor protein MotB [Aneurinibacillus aneurinilyticus]
MSRKKQKHDDHVNLERWLVSYADFVTLLFIVFLILFSMSAVDAQKFQALKESFSDITGSGSSLVMPAPGSAATPTTDKNTGKTKTKNAIAAEQERFEEIKEKMEQYTKSKGLDKSVMVNMDQNGINVTFTGAVLFANGDATLQPQAKGIIKDMFPFINSINNPLRIEGHTDNVPIRTAQYPSNWELSTARATNLVRYLSEEYKIKPERLSGAGYGEYHPIAPNDTPENRAKNRRVEIMILSSKAAAADAQKPQSKK